MPAAGPACGFPCRLVWCAFLDVLPNCGGPAGSLRRGTVGGARDGSRRPRAPQLLRLVQHLHPPQVGEAHRRVVRPVARCVVDVHDVQCGVALCHRGGHAVHDGGPPHAALVFAFERAVDAELVPPGRWLIRPVVPCLVLLGNCSWGDNCLVLLRDGPRGLHLDVVPERLQAAERDLTAESCGPPRLAVGRRGARGGARLLPSAGAAARDLRAPAPREGRPRREGGAVE